MKRLLFVMGIFALAGSTLQDDLSKEEKELLIKDAKEKLASSKLVTLKQEPMTFDKKSNSYLCPNCKKKTRFLEFNCDVYGGIYVEGIYIPVIHYCSADNIYFICVYVRVGAPGEFPRNWHGQFKFPGKESTMDTQADKDKVVSNPRDGHTQLLQSWQNSYSKWYYDYWSNYNKWWNDWNNWCWKNTQRWDWKNQNKGICYGCLIFQDYRTRTCCWCGLSFKGSSSDKICRTCASAYGVCSACLKKWR